MNLGVDVICALESRPRYLRANGRGFPNFCHRIKIKQLYVIWLEYQIQTTVYIIYPWIFQLSLSIRSGRQNFGKSCDSEKTSLLPIEVDYFLPSTPASSEARVGSGGS